MLYEKTPGDLLIRYSLKADLTADLAEVLSHEIKKDVEENKSFEVILFDMQAFTIDFNAFRILSPLGLELRKISKQMYALSSNRTLHSRIRSEGMDLVIRPVSSVEEIKMTAASSRSSSKIDVSFVNPFIEGTVLVLDVQCSTKVSPLKPILKGTEEFDSQTDIAGIIGITSPTFNGSIAICFSEQLFLTLMSRMLGEEIKEITKDLEDGAGELLNMIFGHAKKILNTKGHSIEKALPTIVRASNLSVNHAGTQGAIQLPFEGDVGKFFMEISTEKN